MPKLFMLLIGCSPPGRNIEQHDVFFGIGEKPGDLIPSLIDFWPETNGKLHIDAWREINNVNGYEVTVKAAAEAIAESPFKLFFINLGGYKRNEFEEFHYKIVVAAKDKTEAIQYSKQTAFFRHTGIEGATAHIDDKYGIDVDDISEIRDIISTEHKKNYRLFITPGTALPEDEIHLGYFKLSSFH